MRNLLLIFLFFLICANSVNAKITEKYVCDLTYYNNIVFAGMPPAEADNTAHTMQLFFYLDAVNKKFYNADKKIINNAVITAKEITIDWNSVNDPRFCFLFDRINKTVQYKAYFTLPAKPVGNSGVVMPRSVTKVNGHGVCLITSP